MRADFEVPEEICSQISEVLKIYGSLVVLYNSTQALDDHHFSDTKLRMTVGLLHSK